MMKIMGIFLLMLGCLMAFSISVDVMRDNDIPQALYNAISPFRVMDVAEIFVLFLLVFLFLAETVYLFVKNKKSN